MVRFGGLSKVQGCQFSGFFIFFPKKSGTPSFVQMGKKLPLQSALSRLGYQDVLTFLIFFVIA